MKLSRFNMFFPKDDMPIVYNTRTGVLLKLPLDHYANDLSALPLSVRHLCMEFGLAVHDNLDELLLIRKQLFDQRYNHRDLNITIAPTLDCNLACVYCYEKNYKCTKSMPIEVQDATINFIRQRLTRNSRCKITWYGGEPLLAEAIVLDMTNRIRALALEHQCRFSCGIITNGTLLNQPFLSQMKELGCDTLQITLDGPADVHDRRKPFLGSDASSFEAITKNLKLDFHGMGVNIRSNIDKSNLSSLQQYVEDLADIGIFGFPVYPAPVASWLGAGCQDIASLCYSEPEFVEVRKVFETAARKAGLKPAKTRPFPRSNYCSADTAYAFTVGPDGSLYKCWSHVGDVNLVVGNLMFGTPYVNQVNNWQFFDPTAIEPCMGCVYLPLCMGGCPDKVRYNSERSCDRWKYDLHMVIEDWVNEWYEGEKTSAAIIRNA